MSDELTAVESLLFALELSSDGEEALERFGSYGGIRRATAEELDAAHIAAVDFLACGNALLDYAVEEKRRVAVSSRANASRCAATLMWSRRNRGGVLFLDGKRRVERVLRLGRHDGLKRIVGGAVSSGVNAFMWIRRVDGGDSAKKSRVRIDLARRAMSALKKIGVDAVDYIECRRGRMYSAFFKRYIAANRSDKMPYPSARYDNKIEVIKNGRAFRHGRDIGPDGSGQIYSSVLQGAVR